MTWPQQADRTETIRKPRQNGEVGRHQTRARNGKEAADRGGPWEGEEEEPDTLGERGFKHHFFVVCFLYFGTILQRRN